MEIVSFNQTKNSIGIMSKTILKSCPTDKQEKDVEIVTVKGLNKKLTSYYQYGTYKPAKEDSPFYSFSFVMFQSERGEIMSSSMPRVTAQAIAKQHKDAVAAFIESNGWEINP